MALKDFTSGGCGLTDGQKKGTPSRGMESPGMESLLNNFSGNLRFNIHFDGECYP